ncbi:hypothetical protein WI92_00655 [Burkholderia vietnamiensis]|uniref:hypothetical protein n=1 Tax=Burkholderia vietnamiensis TaxID=60552 RepID=UPI0007528226|nr:hypothetical protein [Burkholderia vietnamiensis]KVE11182.1 hypothetical protein WI92_00655 [Burkholderia vietnamiensis]
MNCKPGDLAYLTASDFPENVGRVVEVTNDGYAGVGGWVWAVVSTVPLKGWILDTWQVSVSRNLAVPDHDLRPINGVPVTDDVEDEVTA